MRLYQLFDKVVGAVEGPIFPFRADAPAVRMFYGLLGNPQTGPGAHPGDFNLLCVGVQDEETGAIVLEEVKDSTRSVYPWPVAIGAAWVEGRNREAASQLSLSPSQER